MAIDLLPTPPSISDPTNFATRADAFLVALQTFASQVNASLALMNSPSPGRVVDLVDTGGGNIATAYAAGQVIDGVTITTGMRILRATTGGNVNDGIYDAPASGAASRSTDANNSALLFSGLTIQVTRGTTYTGTRWVHRTAPGFTLNSTSLYFVRPGEIKKSRVTGVGVNASPTYTNVTSLSLEPGIWELCAVAGENGSGAPSNEYFTVAVGPNSGSLTGTSKPESQINGTNAFPATSAPFGYATLPSVLVTLASTTTYYLICATRSNPDTFDGFLSARRVA